MSIIDNIVTNGRQHFSFPIHFQKDTVLTAPRITNVTYRSMLRRELVRQVKCPVP